MDARHEIELAIEREIEACKASGDEDMIGYGVSIYKNVLECYEAIQPLIEKEGHTGFTYAQFVRIFTRLLKGKILTPLTEKDFEDEFPKESGLGDHIKEDGTITRQCTRYSSLFRDTHPDGTVEYHDNDRIVFIDQYGCGWHSWGAANKCKDLIKPITLPYMPTDEPIEIYGWTFMYNKEKGFYHERLEG